MARALRRLSAGPGLDSHGSSDDPRAGGELPLCRLHRMRTGYAVMGVGLLGFRVPDLFFLEEPWPLEGVRSHASSP